MKYKSIYNHTSKKLFLVLLLISSTTEAIHVVSLTFKPYPVLPKQAINNFSHHLIKGTHLHSEQHESKLVSGIFTTYAGYISVSDYTGRVIFPRMQESNHLHLIVTKHIVPIMMIGNTIHHWEFDKSQSAKIIRAEQKYDPETKFTYWNLQESSIPDDNIVPRDSITIFARPEYIYIPLGITITKPSRHLILPDIYVKPNINKVGEALYLLNLNPFFGTLAVKNKQEKKEMRSIIKP